jgi:hypothetical protein
VQTGGLPQAAEHLIFKHKALSSNTNSTKKKKKKKKESTKPDL